MTTEGGADIIHRPVEIDLDEVPAKLVFAYIGHEPCGVRLELFQEYACRRDFAEYLPVGGARHADADRTGSAVTSQADDPDVVAEILTAELCANAEALRHLVDLGLEFEIAESLAVLVAARRQGIEVTAARELHHLHGELGRRAADDDGQVIGGTGRRPQRFHFLLEEAHHGIGVEQGARLLEQEGFVRRSAAFGDEQELVSVSLVRIELDLGGQIAPCIDFFVHR